MSDAPFQDGAAPVAHEPGSAALAVDAGAQLGDDTSGEERQAAAASELSERVSLRFRAVVAGEPFACGTTYASSSGVRFTPADLRFFVQDLALLTPDGEEQPVALDVRPPWQTASVALLDFEDASGACLAGTRELNLEITGRVPRGDYRGAVFTNGVPEELNHADPSRLPPPLQAGSMSWGWLLGYRFLVAEIAAIGGGADAGALGSALLHVGSSACSGNPSAGGVVCAKRNRNRVRLPALAVEHDVIVVDVAELFGDMNLDAVTTCHSSGSECAPFFERLGIDLERGAATGGQRIYRVEPSTAGPP